MRAWLFFGMTLALATRALPAPSGKGGEKPLSQAPSGVSGEFQTVSVRPGDTLGSVAKAYLRDPGRWEEIARSNGLSSPDPAAALSLPTLRLPVKLVREELQAARLVYTINRSLFRRKDGSDWVPTTENMDLFRNDSVRTFAGSKAVVKFADDELMQIDSDSMAIIMPSSKDYQVELKRGGVVAGNKKVMMGSALVTPETTDTVYTASLGKDKSTLVQVFRGQAEVRSGGKTVQVDAGKATEVRQGASPSLPFAIPDLGGLKSWVAGFESQIAALKIRLGKPGPPPRVPVPPRAPLPLADVHPAADLSQDTAGSLQAIMGFRIQCSRTQDFTLVLTDRFFEADSGIGPESFGLPYGQYWCRIAQVDLLGNLGEFKAPKPYFLGTYR